MNAVYTAPRCGQSTVTKMQKSHKRRAKRQVREKIARRSSVFETCSSSWPTKNAGFARVLATPPCCTYKICLQMHGPVRAPSPICCLSAWLGRAYDAGSNVCVCRHAGTNVCMHLCKYSCLHIYVHIHVSVTSFSHGGTILHLCVYLCLLTLVLCTCA